MFTKEKIKDLHYSVSGKISAEDIQKMADEVLTEFGKTAKIAGFRQGKGAHIDPAVRQHLRHFRQRAGLILQKNGNLFNRHKAPPLSDLAAIDDAHCLAL